MMQISDIDNFSMLPFRYRSKLPKKSGIYIIMHDLDALYIGSTINLFRRINNHELIKKFKGHSQILYLLIKNVKNLRPFEKQYINCFNPILNKNVPSQDYRLKNGLISGDGSTPIQLPIKLHRQLKRDLARKECSIKTFAGLISYYRTLAIRYLNLLQEKANKESLK